MANESLSQLVIEEKKLRENLKELEILEKKAVNQTEDSASKSVLVKIIQKYGDNIADIADVTEEEEQKLRNFEHNRMAGIVHTFFTIEGKLDFAEAKRRYQEYQEKLPGGKNVYLKALDGQQKRIELRSVYQRLECYDMSNLGENQKLIQVAFGKVIASDIRRGFDFTKEAFLRGMLFRISSTKSIFMLTTSTRWKYPFSTWKLANEVFPGTKFTNLSMDMVQRTQLISNRTKKETLDYWGSYMMAAKEETYPPGYHKAGTERLSSVSQCVIKKEIFGLIKKNLQAADLSLEAYLETFWSVLLAKYYDMTSSTYAILCQTQNLRLFPRLVDLSSEEVTILSLAKELERTKKHQQQYSTCSDAEMRQHLQLGGALVQVLSFDRMDEGKIFQTDEVGGLESVEVLEEYGVDLFVGFRPKGDELAIEMTYNENCFTFRGIKCIQQMYLELADKLSKHLEVPVSRLNIKNRTVLDSAEKEYACQELEQLIFLKKSELFSSYSVEELRDLRQKMEFRHLIEDDVIMKEKSISDEIMLIFKGKVSKQITSLEGEERPVCVMKEGDVLSFAPYFSNGLLNASYLVVSEEAQLLTMKNNVFAECVKHNPKLYEVVIKKQLDRIGKLERLWINAE